MPNEKPLDSKIGLIGLGVVGGAIYKYFSEQHDQVVGFDLYKGIGNFENCLETSYLYLCLPTQFNESTKTYDLSEIEKTFQKLNEHKYRGLIVVKSTVLPGTTERLNKTYPALRVVHHPEFLKARTAYEDYAGQKRLIYGLPTKTYKKRQLKTEIRRLNRVLHPKARVIFSHSNESEMIKIMSNSYYATQIQFFNEIYGLSREVNCNYPTVIQLLKQADLHHIDCTTVPGPDGQLSYSGMCLPKDSNALLGLMQQHQTPHHQLEATITERNSMRNDEVNVQSVKEAKITMYDPTREYREHQIEFVQAIGKVLESGAYIGGKAISELEQRLAKYVGVRYCLGVSSGTDALLIALMALGVKAGDEVITVSFSWVSTVTMVELLGAKTVFVDISPDDYNLDVCCIRNAITSKTRGIIVVSLFGQMADFDSINKLAKEKGLWVIEDGAQSFGASYSGRKSCSVTQIGTTSFFPTKPLGCFGDGGAVFTNDTELASKMQAIRNHGAIQRPHHQYLGINGRLDTIQASVLLVKLDYFDEQIKKRQANADYYYSVLEDIAKEGRIILPKTKEAYTHVWAQYTVFLPTREKRDQLVELAAKKEIALSVFYPIPIHKQPFIASESVLPVTSLCADRVVSLPVYPELTRVEQDRVCNVVKEVLA